jgi:hypothetical protein
MNDSDDVQEFFARVPASRHLNVRLVSRSETAAVARGLFTSMFIERTRSGVQQQLRILDRS